MDLVPQSRYFECLLALRGCWAESCQHGWGSRLNITTWPFSHSPSALPLFAPAPTSPSCQHSARGREPLGQARSIRVERPKMAGAVACGGRERGRKCRFPVFSSPLSYSLAGHWRGLEPLARWGKRNVSLTWSGQRPGIISFVVR